MSITFDEIDGFIKIYYGNSIHLLIAGSVFRDEIFYKIKYLISKKSGIAHSINHNLKIRIDSYNSLTIKNIDFS